ncbi:MAG TPA: DUF2780 domain-containing protein [Steroidobacteraceae bacterium]|nr:DUF2780 domain-containing protein [Steroidobacteraceae bacterium]
MHDLVKSLTTELGVTPAQAQGGAGAIFKAAQERLGGGQFDQLLGGLPGVKDLLSHAPAAGSRGGGLFGGLAAMAGKMGGGDVAQAAQLLSQFSSLGMNKDTLMKFVPVVMKFLESQGGKDLVTQVRTALKI